MLSSTGRCLSLLAVMALCAPSRLAAQPAPAANACLTCHATLTETKLSTPAALFSGTDVHRERGFACIDCHGGDSSAGDKARAHDAARGFKGAPVGQAQIATCARCHSDATLMRRFAPRQRVDQATEYATSVHGRQLAAGHTDVATCASCHGPHGIRAVGDAKSPVFPTNVAATCAACHADPRHMAEYKLPGGTAIPTRQFADYQKSVHYAALTKGNDLSAPTCNDCHGNHGATPPGVGAVVNVCGTCHAVFATKFQTSVHAQIFDKGCVECHSNHAVLKPSDDMLGSGAHALCASCHSGPDDKGAAAADRMRRGMEGVTRGIVQSGELIARVRNAGIEVSNQELALAEARSRLTLARREIHSSDPAAVDTILAEATTILAGVDRAGQDGVLELRFRRRGLALSLGAIMLLVVALWFKIKQIDRRSHPR
ncbi:MAG: cytochrome c3 family protein [Acidobacteriota bacterium]